MISVFRPVSDAAASVYTLNYTTESLTRDVDVKPIHSHNDYWRHRPLFDALSFGCASVEADVWIFDKNYTVVPETETTSTKEFGDNEVYVGHNQLYLQPNNTLWSLYLGPIYSFLNSVDPACRNNDGSNRLALRGDKTTKHGLFYSSPEVPLHILFDVKTEANSTYAALKSQIQPFIDAQYLTHYDTTQKKWIPGPLTITISGNQATELVKEETVRYMFLDSPLVNMKSNASTESLQEYSQLAVIASASLEQLLGKNLYALVATQELGDQAKTTLKNYFDTAHKLGLKTRIWGGNTWPIHIRNAQMSTLWELGCDLVNADDLEYAAKQF